MARWITRASMAREIGSQNRADAICDTCKGEVGQKVLRDWVYDFDATGNNAYFFCGDDCHEKWLPTKTKLAREAKEKALAWRLNAVDGGRPTVVSGGLPSLGKRR